ncbi:hypothetical protein [Pseudomonas lopnurensis]|uniref:hypothetical protein n=1 Tax=Pseudomonas lopnurensis TaxID=1477517 RepID=UPI0028A810B9|nr:hypothetical protein [Pseudomonas lopnurensis]
MGTVERGGWAKYHPQKAYGLVQRFMEKDGESRSHWFDVEPGFALDCLLLGDGDQRQIHARLIEQGLTFRQFALAKGYDPRTVIQTVARWAGFPWIRTAIGSG